MEIYKLKGTVECIGNLVQMGVKDSVQMYKKVVTIVTFDNQKLYVDVINHRLKTMDDKGIEEGSIVEIEYSFKGSEKDGKKYNNIFCNSINKV